MKQPFLSDNGGVEGSSRSCPTTRALMKQPFLSDDEGVVGTMGSRTLFAFTFICGAP